MNSYTKILLVLFCTACLLASGCKSFSQEDTSNKNAKILLDSIIQIAKINAYNSSNVNWDSLSQEMFSMVEQFDSIDKIGKPTEHMYKTLGDFHGMLMYDYKVAYSYKPTEGGIPRDPMWQTITRSKIKLPYPVIGKILRNNIAYIELVGTGVMQDEDIKLARDTIRAMICSLKESEPIGWILDLRCNTGGNMHPMMAGIGALITDADLGGDTKDGVNYDSTWSLKNGNFLENGYAHYEKQLQCPTLKNNTRIAVLTSEFTASAGEVVVSSLKGQKNVMLIGEKTAGLSSANGWYVLPDKWVLAPMKAYFMSSDKTVHYDGIIPDVQINEKLDLKHLTKGAVMERAIIWIKSGA